MRSLLLALFAVSSSGLELTKETWDAATAGKSVFAKFFAPWCGHCKRMKPDWDKLMAEFKDSKTAVVADVDCTAGGKELCNELGVRGYPTLKHGDPNNLEDYKGGRTLDALKEFAEKNLGPTCGPNNLDLCDDEKKAEIAKFQAMSEADLNAFIKDKDAAMSKAEEDMKTAVEGFQKQYEALSSKKDKDIEAIKNSGLGVAKAVKGANSGGKKEL